MQPTPRQLRYLRALADRTGTTFSSPATRAEASRLIDEMRTRTTSSPSDRALERRDSGDAPAPATDFRADETTGYGSTARWTGR